MNLPNNPDRMIVSCKPEAAVRTYRWDGGSRCELHSPVCPCQAISIPCGARSQKARGHAAVLRSLPDVVPFVQTAQVPFCPLFGGCHASSKAGHLSESIFKTDGVAIAAGLIEEAIGLRAEHPVSLRGVASGWHAKRP